MRSLIPVSFLENADYPNPDGSFTRFPEQIWIEGDIAKQSAEHVLILQYKNLLEEVSKDLERSKVQGNSEMNYVLDRINSRIAKVCPTPRAVDLLSCPQCEGNLHNGYCQKCKAAFEPANH